MARTGRFRIPSIRTWTDSTFSGAAAPLTSVLAFSTLHFAAHAHSPPAHSPVGARSHTNQTRRVSLTPFQSPPLAKPKETTLRMSAADLGGFSLPTGPNLGGFDPFEDDGKASKKTESKASGAVHIRVQQRVRLDLEIETLPYAWTPLLSHYLTCVSRSMARRMEKSP